MESPLALCGDSLSWRCRHLCLPRTLRTLLLWDSRMKYDNRETCVICGVTMYAHDDWYELDDKFDAIETDNGFVCYGCWMHTRLSP